MRWPPPNYWPHVAHSRQVHCRPHRWHVQEIGSGPTLLMLHGAGGSTHSFRGLLPLLAKDYRVIALDLPGQGFTKLGARHRSGLEATCEDLERLCVQEKWSPVALVGHSAGAALALRLSQKLLSPRGQTPKVVGINPALDTFKGLAGVLFPAMAKLLAAVPFTAQIFSKGVSAPGRVESLIGSTGSELDAEGLNYYRLLTGDRDHADAALLMMAQWSLDQLLRDLPQIEATTLFITGSNDATVPPKVSDQSAARMPNAKVIALPDLGHLVHEEAPEKIATLIKDFLRS